MNQDEDHQENVMRAIVFAIVVCCSSIAFAAEPQTVKLRLKGSAEFGAGLGVVVQNAVLFVDTTRFDGKSGMVRLQKGLTVIHLVLSSREAGCVPSGEFDKKAFLQRNVIPIPTLPDLTAKGDYVIAVEALESFDPKKTSTSTLLQAITSTPITKLTSMAPWVGPVSVPSVVVDSIHLHVARAEAITHADKEKIFASASRFFSRAGTVISIAPGHTALHHQTNRSEPPFDQAQVVLQRDGDSWNATLDIESKEMSLQGTVPVLLCEPVDRTINEYGSK